MVLCPNCHCEIEDSKMVLHERFCKQTMKYCEDCEEAIPIEEYDEHISSHKSTKKNSLDLQKQLSKDEKNSLSLKKVMSSKIGCEFCGYPLSFSEIEEHEQMCGSRSTQCKICHQKLIMRNLEEHLKAKHGMDKDVYEEQNNDNQLFENNDSQIFENNFNDSQLGSLNLQNMSSSEQLDYAIKLSEKEAMKNLGKNDNNSGVKEDKKKENDEPDLSKLTEEQQIAYAIAQSAKEAKEEEEKKKKKENKMDLQKIPSINFDEVDEEMERYMYEQEMENFQ